LLQEIEHAGDERSPFGRRVQVHVAVRHPREEGTDKKSRLIKALGRKTAVLQFLEDSRGNRTVAGRANGIHGICLSVETKMLAPGLRKALEGYASRQADSTDQARNGGCPGSPGDRRSGSATVRSADRPAARQHAAG